MWNASQDANGRYTLLWVSSIDGKTPIPIKVNPITGRVLIEFVGSAIGVQPSGTPFTAGQIATYLTTDGYQIGALSGSGYVKLASGVPSVLSAIVASDITQSASYRFVTDTEKTTWNSKQNALGFTPENSANKGLANGYAGLDATGKVPSAQLPSFVDDVLEYANLAGFPWTGETGKIYVALDTNKTYRWSGSAYVEISPSPWSTDSVTEGSTNLYFTTARVLGTLLTGLSTATNAVITASDSVLSSLGKLQKQITDLTTTVGTKANDNAVVHLAGTETVTGQKKFNKIVESNMDNTTNGAGFRANGSDHVYFEWLINLVRRAYIGFWSAGNTTLTVANEQTNGDINLVTNGTGKAKVNGVEIPMTASGNPTGMVMMWSTASAPTGYLLCDWSAVSRSTYSALFWVIWSTYGAGDGSTTFNLPNMSGRVAMGVKSAVSKGAVTISIASPWVITLASHGLSNWQKVYFTTTGALPTGISPSVEYYIVNATSGTFQISATLGGTAINTSGTQSGTHTLFSSDFTLGTSGGKENHVLSLDEMPAHTHSLVQWWYTSEANGIFKRATTNTGSNGADTSSTGGGIAHINLPPYTVMNYIIKT